jgi:hypothetical protein
VCFPTNPNSSLTRSHGRMLPNAGSRRAGRKIEGNYYANEREAGMLAESRPDIVLAFPGGRRTANLVKQAKAAGVWVLTVD